MTEPGETDGYTAADHLDALHRHGMRGVVDVVLVNDAPVSADLVAGYRARWARARWSIDEQRLRELGREGGARRRWRRRATSCATTPGRLAQALLRTAEVARSDLRPRRQARARPDRAADGALPPGAALGHPLRRRRLRDRRPAAATACASRSELPATARHVLALLKSFGVDGDAAHDERRRRRACATRWCSATRPATCSCSTSSACSRTTCVCR